MAAVLPAQPCVAAVAGEQRAEVMAKLCGVDLSEAAFPLGSVAQTQAARVSVIVAAHQNENGQPVFSIFVDQSLARYSMGSD